MSAIFDKGEEPMPEPFPVYEPVGDFNDFHERVKLMNCVMGIEANEVLTNLGLSRLKKFRDIIFEEFKELDLLIEKTEVSTIREDNHRQNTITQDVPLTKEELKDFLDWLVDMGVYQHSEAYRWGLPLQEATHIVMDSQESKLVDGKPIKDPHTNKFLKGPDYKAPDDRLIELLSREQDRASDYHSRFGS